MKHQEDYGSELPFHSDFAVRVMDEADAITAQRHRTRAALGAIAVAVAAVSAWQMWPARAPGTQRIPREIASSEPIEVADFQTAQLTLLDFVFPSASTLSQFLDQYSEGDSADVMETDGVFFPDGEEDAEIDNS